MAKEAPKSRPRMSSVSLRTPAPPAKSAKPPTKPAFELPGEAISRRLKEQREQRLKQEAEERQKKREFKARPLKRNSIAPTVRETAASRARVGLMGTDGTGAVAEATKPGKAAPVSVSTPRGKPQTGSVRKTTTRPRLSAAVSRTPVRQVQTVPLRPSLSSSTPKASKTTMTIIGAGLVSKSSTKPRTNATVASTLTQRHQRFGLDRANQQQQRKEKESAARKAREEASERSRLKSKAWAERQRLRLKAHKAVLVSSDEGSKIATEA